MDRHCQEIALIVNTLNRLEVKRRLSLIDDWLVARIRRLCDISSNPSGTAKRERRILLPFFL